MSVQHLGLEDDRGHDGRVPPFDQVAEQSALGGMMLSPEAILDAMEAVQPRDYYLPKHEVIHQAIVTLTLRGEPADVIAVTEELTKTGELGRCGGAEYLWHLTNVPPTSANAGYYAAIVADKAARRRLVEAGTRMVQMGYASEGEISALLENAQSELDTVASETRAGVRMVRDILPGVINRLQSNETFTLTPWPSLNKMIAGLRPGCVYVIAARPGVGKSVLAMQIAAKLADYGRVAFSSLEMSEDELVSRLIAERLGISVGKVKDNHMTSYDWEVLAKGRHSLEDLNIAIDARANVSGIEVRSHAKAVAREGKLSGVVVDYLQLMTSNSKSEREKQVSEFSRQLKVMAKDLGVPVIALSQLNRKSEDRLDKKPQLAHLRESGAIEQDADVVMLLRREENDGHTFENPMESLWIDVAKNRHGETGEVELYWEGRYSRAVEWS